MYMPSVTWEKDEKSVMKGMVKNDLYKTSCFDQHFDFETEYDFYINLRMKFELNWFCSSHWEMK